MLTNQNRYSYRQLSEEWTVSIVENLLVMMMVVVVVVIVIVVVVVIAAGKPDDYGQRRKLFI